MDIFYNISLIKYKYKYVFTTGTLHITPEQYVVHCTNSIYYDSYTH